MPSATTATRSTSTTRGNGAPAPGHQVILTGNGGNPFTESGWTGWTALDNGSSLTNDPSLGGPSLSMSPCFQTGVLVGTFNGAALVGPNGEGMTDTCNTQTGIATLPLPRNAAARRRRHRQLQRQPGVLAARRRRRPTASAAWSS